MKTPTDEQIAALKTKALAVCGRDDLALVEHDEADFAGLFRAPTREEWKAYLDGVTSGETALDARWNALVKTLMFPSTSELASARGRCPALPTKLAEGFEQLAGGHDTYRPRVLPLDADTSADTLAEVGIPEDVARALLAKYPAKRQLQIAVHPLAGSFVLKVPTGAAWDAFGQRSTAAHADACHDLAVDCIVYPEHPGAILQRFPGVPYLLATPIAKLGGGHTKARVKKV